MSAQPSDTPHELPVLENPHTHGAGPTSGVIIIVLLLIAGALYYVSTGFTRSKSADTLPFILGSSTADQ